MNTTTEYFLGDEVTKLPPEGYKCHRCGCDIGGRVSHKLSDIAITESGFINIRWDWFCEDCYIEFAGVLNRTNEWIEEKIKKAYEVKR